MDILSFNWLDVVIILVLGMGAYIGYKKGIIVAVFNTVGVIAALFLSKLISNPVSQFLTDNTKLYENIRNKILGKIDTLNPVTVSSFKIAGVDDAAAADKLSSAVMGIIVFIICFVIGLIIVAIVRNVLKAVVDRTPVGAIDKLGGMVLGFVMSALLLFVFFASITTFSGVLSNGTVLIDAANESELAQYFIHYDFIIPWFESIRSV